jgi:hypothetical protein
LLGRCGVAGGNACPVGPLAGRAVFRTCCALTAPRKGEISSPAAVRGRVGITGKRESRNATKKSARISMSVFPGLSCFIVFSGVSQRWEFRNTTKNVLQNKSCRKVFTKKSTKNSKPLFSRFFFITFLGVSR